MKSTSLLLLILISGIVSASEFDDIRTGLIGKYIVLQAGKETKKGVEFTKETFSFASLDEIIGAIPAKVVKVNKYKLAKMESGEFYIIPQRSIDSDKYDDGFRIEKIEDGWRLYAMDGKDGDPGVLSMTLRTLHFQK